MSDFLYQHPGGCACGAVSYHFHCNLALDELRPRACQCLFCLPREAAYISATDARLEIRVRDARYLYAHVFGTNTADFMHCGRCNHLVYVRSVIEGREYGLITVESLQAELPPASGHSADFSEETLDGRLQRRSQTWIPQVDLREAP